MRAASWPWRGRSSTIIGRLDEAPRGDVSTMYGAAFAKLGDEGAVRGNVNAGGGVDGVGGLWTSTVRPFCS